MEGSGRRWAAGQVAKLQVQAGKSPSTGSAAALHGDMCWIDCIPLKVAVPLAGEPGPCNT